VSAAQQIEWHQGYEPRATDLADLAVLRGLPDALGGRSR
jgi:hypothetical protein